MATSTNTRSLSIRRAAMRFTAPLRISGYVFDAMPAIVAEIGDGSHAGRGEAAGVYYLGDDQDRMAAEVESVRGLIEVGLCRRELQSALAPCGARNALDCALWELEARSAGTSVWELAGVPRPKPLVTTFTLPVGEPAALREKLDRLPFARALKIKLDGELDADRERIAAVRAARPDAWLSVDANQGFEPHDLEGLARLINDFSVALVEQPCRRGEEEWLKDWRPGIPVAADESILGLDELRARGELFDVINIKLDKCGGLTEALAMAREVWAMGKQLMVGNMGGSTLAMAPAFVLAQLCDYVDLDGPFELIDDPLAGELYNDGRIFVPETIWGCAGFGPN